MGSLLDYFSPYVNDIDDEIVKVLGGIDISLKYTILLGLILNPSSANVYDFAASTESK